MPRPEFNVVSRRATRVRPGVIVSTVTDTVVAQTVVFCADPSAHRGFRMAAITYAPPGRDREAHQRAVTMARHPSNPLALGLHRGVDIDFAGLGAVFAPLGIARAIQAEAEDNATALRRLPSALAAKVRRRGREA